MSKVFAFHSKDVIANYINSNTDVIRIREISSEINKLTLLSGRMPLNKNEVLIDEKYLLNSNAKIGDEFELLLDEDDDTLNADKLTIVGIVNSPLYLATNEGSLNRGNTLIGNGEVKYYVYALSDIFNMDYYTEIYIDNLLSDSDITNSKAYNEKTNLIIDKIDGIKEERVKYRYEELRGIALNKIQKEEEKINKEIVNSKNMLALAKDKLDNAKYELVAKKQYLDSAAIEINNVKIQLDEAAERINSGEKELAEKKQELDDIKNSIDNYDNLLIVAKKNKNSTLTKDDIISILPDDEEKENTINNLELAESLGADLSNLTIIREQMINLGINDETLIGKINKLEENLNAVLEIENAYLLYDSKVIELNNYKKELEDGNKAYEIYLNEYTNGLLLYYDAKEQYDSELGKYNNANKELTEKENIAKEEFEKARKEVDEKIVLGTWLIRNRLDNVDYSGFIDSIESLKKLSFIFPIIFFVVAIFISLLSMARMGIEDRSEIGTLKAFGFSKYEILIQYIIYSFSATIIGSIIGSVLGIYVFPKFVFDVYANLYSISNMVYSNFIGVTIIGVLISIICIVGSTIFVIIRILKAPTLKLLRPIAPQIGKKILLEKIPFFWNKISFANKITLRNIFRYKRRVVMTVVGIVSCTMILVSAFLIRDSITTVLDKQFKEIFTYDSMIYLDGSKLSYELDDIFNDEHIDEIMYADLERVQINDTSVNLIAVNNTDDLKKIIQIKNGNRTIELNNDGVVITSKLAKMLKIKANDIITIKMVDNSIYNLKVSDIAENYIGNYIYMTKELYQNIIGIHKLNIAYLKLDNIENEEMVVKNLLDNNKNILNYLSIKNSISMVKNMFVSLNKVVLIVVVFSLLLSIVVLYSLAYIIISERQREIATLKVLGFDNEEVDMYLLKEQVIIVIIGIILGLIIGIFYSLELVNTLEISMIQFNKDLLFRNYIICICLMLVFASIVGQLIHTKLRKISMIESLKSVE